MSFKSTPDSMKFIPIINLILQIIAEAKRNFKKAQGFPIIVRLFQAEFEIQSLALNAIGYLITREGKESKELLFLIF